MELIKPGLMKVSLLRFFKPFAEFIVYLHFSENLYVCYSVMMINHNTRILFQNKHLISTNAEIAFKTAVFSPRGSVM